MILLKICSLIFKMLILAGFLYQVSLLSFEYFAYSTTSNFNVIENYDIKLYARSRTPKLAVCLIYADILDMRMFTAKYDAPPAGLRPWTSTYRQYIQSKVTVKDIFQMTPSSSDSLTGCYYRNIDGLLYLKYDNVSDCHSLFTASRFYSIEFMCYAYAPKYPIPIQTVSMTLNSPSFMYGLTLVEQLTKANKTLFVVYDSDYPFTSMLYGLPYSMWEDNKRVEGVTVRYNRILNQLQPPPFDTMCIQNATACRIRCYETASILLNREFSSNIVPFASKRHHLSYDDLRNETVRQIVAATEQKCSSECMERGCSLTFTVTIADDTWLDDHDSQPLLYVHVKTPQQPDIQVIAVARLDLFSFWIYLCNCFNIWFGIDFMFFLRVGKKSMRKKKKKSRTRAKPNRRRLTVAERRQRMEMLPLPWYCVEARSSFRSQVA